MQMEIPNQDEYILKGKLARHETFTPRYGWLKKGYEAVVNDGNVFKAPDAIERLGVGKNMVSSIRFWCQAFKLIEQPEINTPMRPTELGCKLLDNDGWDPFLEDVASLWLLHWQLFVPELEAVSWSFAFNKCNLLSFDISLLNQVIFNASQKYPRFASISEKTFYRDASCIIRMYEEESSDKSSEIECPFTQLGIIRKAEDNNFVYFDTSEKQNLPTLIFTAACFSYISAYVPTSQKTISLQSLTYNFNSPGVVYKLPETLVGSYLEEAAEQLQGISFEHSGGIPQLILTKDPKTLYWDALEKYYKEQ